MKKFSPEEIERMLDENFGFANVKEAMLFMQAEVLRMNGEAVTAERQACASLCRRLYEEEMADGYECEQAIIARGNETAAPRATGCSDTMDDTARFAAEELPEILRKQAG